MQTNPKTEKQKARQRLRAPRFAFVSDSSVWNFGEATAGEFVAGLVQLHVGAQLACAHCVLIECAVAAGCAGSETRPTTNQNQTHFFVGGASSPASLTATQTRTAPNFLWAGFSNPANPSATRARTHTRARARTRAHTAHFSATRLDPFNAHRAQASCAPTSVPRATAISEQQNEQNQTNKIFFVGGASSPANLAAAQTHTAPNFLWAGFSNPANPRQPALQTVPAPEPAPALASTPRISAPHGLAHSTHIGRRQAAPLQANVSAATFQCSSTPVLQYSIAPPLPSPTLPPHDIS